MKIFIDTSAFVALFVENETEHKKVAKKYHDYRQQRAVLFTSYYILDELYTRLLYFQEKIDFKKIIQTLKDAVAANELTILQIDEAVFEKSLDSFLKFSEHKLSFTDVTSYLLFKDFELDEVFTLDSDFKKIGINTSILV